MSIDPTTFRRVMRRFATGVTVLTVRDGERIHGMTANAFTSVSLSPTLTLICVQKPSTTHEFITHADNFAINILGSLGIAVANACSHPDVGFGNSYATTGRVDEAHRSDLSRQFPKSHILSDAHEFIAKRFAKQVLVPADPFADITCHSAVTGAPILDDCIAYTDCRVVAAHDAGDHTIFVGQVQDAGFGKARSAKPLLWLDGRYTTLNHESDDPLLLAAHSIQVDR